MLNDFLELFRARCVQEGALTAEAAGGVSEDDLVELAGKLGEFYAHDSIVELRETALAVTHDTGADRNERVVSMAIGLLHNTPPSLEWALGIAWLLDVAALGAGGREQAP